METQRSSSLQLLPRHSHGPGHSKSCMGVKLSRSSSESAYHDECVDVFVCQIWKPGSGITDTGCEAAAAETDMRARSPLPPRAKATVDVLPEF